MCLHTVESKQGADIAEVVPQCELYVDIDGVNEHEVRDTLWMGSWCIVH